MLCSGSAAQSTVLSLCHLLTAGSVQPVAGGKSDYLAVRRAYRTGSVRLRGRKLQRAGKKPAAKSLLASLSKLLC